MPRRRVGMEILFRRVGQARCHQLNESRTRGAQSGDEIKQRRFSRTGRAEYGGDAAAHFDIHFECEIGKWQRNVFQQQAHVLAFLWRRKNSLHHTAAKASTTDTPSRRKACAS